MAYFVKQISPLQKTRLEMDEDDYGGTQDHIQTVSWTILRQTAPGVHKGLVELHTCIQSLFQVLTMEVKGHPFGMPAVQLW